MLFFAVNRITYCRNFTLLQVKDIENAVADLLRTSEECALYSSAIQSVGYAYQPTNQVLEICLYDLTMFSSSAFIPCASCSFVCCFN